jgi:hypothetical protein
MAIVHDADVFILFNSTKQGVAMLSSVLRSSRAHASTDRSLATRRSS